jgi:hypothetical protein
MTIKQRKFQLLLEDADLAAHGRLVQSKRCARSGEAACPCHTIERSNPVPIQDRLPHLRGRARSADRRTVPRLDKPAHLLQLKEEVLCVDLAARADVNGFDHRRSIRVEAGFHLHRLKGN